MRAPLRLLLLGGLALAPLAGCGDGGTRAGSPAPATREVSVALDFTPNPDHAALYEAAARGLDVRQGVRLRLRAPGEGPDALKQLATGRADVAVVDIHDLGLARRAGQDVVGVGALVQRPLAALVGDPALKRPRDLEGKLVGVSGLPSDPAFLDAVVRADGGDPRKVRRITIGFNAVGALLARKVDAVPVFWNAEGVALRRRGRRTSEFRVERYGAPPYPELLLVTTRETATRRADLVRRVLRAVAGGVAATLADPAGAARLVARAADADPTLTRAQLDAVAPLLSPPLRLDRAVLERWASYDARIGLLPRRPDVARAFVFGLAPAG